MNLKCPIICSSLSDVFLLILFCFECMSKNAIQVIHFTMLIKEYDAGYTFYNGNRKMQVRTRSGTRQIII